MQTAAGDPARALDLYGHQAHVSSTLWQTIGHVEVLVRNAMHDALSEHSADWYDRLDLAFNEQTREDIAKARARVKKYQPIETPGHIVAELNFGFWRFLLAKRYDRVLWTPYLHAAFPNYSGARDPLFSEMVSLNDDRNAVAHHQRISDAKRTRKKCLQIAGYICADTRDWIDSECRVMAALADAP